MGWELGNMIHKSLKQGKDCFFDPYVIIEEDVVLGDEVQVAYFACIMKGTKIGHTTYIGQYVRTGYNCIIGDNCDIKARAIIGPDATVGNNCFIGPGAMILHGLPDGTHFVSGIGDNCSLGAGAIVGPGVTLEDNVILGANSYAHTDCLKPGLYVGNPARRKG